MSVHKDLLFLDANPSRMCAVAKSNIYNWVSPFVHVTARLTQLAANTNCRLTIAPSGLDIHPKSTVPSCSSTRVLSTPVSFTHVSSIQSSSTYVSSSRALSTHVFIILFHLRTVHYICSVYSDFVCTCIVCTDFVYAWFKCLLLFLQCNPRWSTGDIIIHCTVDVDNDVTFAV